MTAATSDPPPGSVTASDPINSPASVGRTNRSIRSTLPTDTMCGNAIPCVSRLATSPDEPPAWINSSVATIVSSRSPPLPPTDSSNPMPSSPMPAAVLCNSRGNSPARSQPSRLSST